MKKKILYMMIMLLSLGIMSTNPKNIKAKEEIEIITSFYPMYALTKTLVGDLHPVKMINSQNGIHGFEPSAFDVATIKEADLFVYHSDVLESWVKKMKQSLKENDVRMIEAAEELNMQRVEGLEHVSEIKGMSMESMQDPHTWMDPIHAAEEIKLIAQSLSEIDPVNASIYQERAKEFEYKANAIVEKYTPLFEDLENRTFVTQHTAFSYLSNRFGLTQLGIAGISNTIEPGSKQMIEIIKFINENNVKTIFLEPGVSAKPAKVIADETGADIAILNPLERLPENNLTFIENLEHEIDVLYQCLKQ